MSNVNGRVALGLLGMVMGAIPATTSAAAADTADSVIVSGEFSRIDRSHWARGGAAIVYTDDGRYVLRLGDGFESARGPDLRVVLSTASSPTRGRDLGDYVELGRLTRNRGAQDFALPGGTDIETLGSVVIYCKRFDVLFSVARLTAPSGSSAPAGIGRWTSP